MTTDGDKGHIIVHAEKEGNAFNNFLYIAGTVAGGADLTPHPIRLVQTGPGTYEADFDASQPGQLHLLSDLRRAERQERIAPGRNDRQQLAGTARSAKQRRTAEADRRSARAAGC